MNLNPPATLQDVPPSMGRRQWLVLLALAFVAFGVVRVVKHRAEAAKARAERRQALRIQEEMVQKLAGSNENPGPIRSGPVWVESKQTTGPEENTPASVRSRHQGESTPNPVLLALTTQGSSPTAGAAPAILHEPSDNDSGKVRKNRGEDLFDACVVPKLVIEVPRAGVAALENNPRKYVLATVHEGAFHYTNVALKLKGSIGSFRGFGDTPSLTLNFEKFAEGQTFHGLKKLHLNSSVQDRSFLCEKISRELFNAAGVPTPRAGHALLTLNGRKMGLYVLLEGINRQFLKRHFKDPGGNVYDGRAGKDIGAQLQVNEGENPSDRSRLRALKAAASEADLEVRLERLNSVLDVDRFLTFAALETILAHWDGYTVSHNNYRIFHDRTQDRMVFLPHGMDQVLGQRDVDLVPSTQALVARSVLEVPEFRSRYRARLAAMATNVFQPAVIANRVREIVSRVEPVLAIEDPEAAAAFRRRSNGFQRRVLDRSMEVERELFGARRFANRGTNSIPSLASWTPRLDVGAATLERVQDERGRHVLRVTTAEGCTASWRSRAILEPGRYRLEGSLRTKGVEFDDADPRSGAGFRISRQRVGQKNGGDRDWSAVRHEFEVKETAPDVEVICELRAKKGVLWLDPESISLTRIER